MNRIQKSSKNVIQWKNYPLTPFLGATPLHSGKANVRTSFTKRSKYQSTFIALNDPLQNEQAEIQDFRI